MVKLRKTTKVEVRIVLNPAEIQTGYLQNTDIKHDGYRLA
jgi:hypothetical protein